MSANGNARISPARLALAVRKLRAEQDIDLIASDPIAVIGMGCRFPAQSDSPEAFWAALVEGRCGFIEMPDHRWKDKAGLQPEQRIGGYLGKIDEFDAEYFGISPREAAQMDPQQRLLLEVVWEALWDAGLEPSSLAGSDTGVFAAIYNSDYSRMLFQNRASLTAHAGIGTAHSIAAGRLAFLLDIKGPNVAVDSACSSSLVATHMAVQSLRAGECGIAIVGASSLKILPDEVVVFSKWGMLSRDGRCKTFDAAADGFVPGEGCGAIVLKRMSDALQDGDRIRAVIRGTATNQDGRSTVLTAPNGLSQQAVIRAALANARMAPSEVSYVETHGTGTSLGDPIEVEALQAVYGSLAPDARPCRLGAVKTNVGHLEAAAGLAGIIKTVLCLENEFLPRNLHFEKLNPQIQLDGSRLALLTEGTPWLRDDKARVAGVSSFGLGGTNSHIILEEAPALPANRPATQGRIIPLPRREWQRHRCWLADPTATSTSRDGYVHPLLGNALGSAFVDGRLFQSEIAAASTRYLADHRIGDQVIFPFAAFLELARAAAAEARGNHNFTIRDFTLQDPLFLSSNPRKLQVLVRDRSIEIASERGSAWVRHGSAALDSSAELHREVDLAALRARFHDAIAPGEIYRRLESTGLTYGPSFRVIQQAWRSSGECLALLRLPQELDSESSEYGIHPALLDGCLQTVIAARDLNDAELFLPIALDAADFSKHAEREFWVHTQIVKSSPDLISARIVVVSGAGEQVAVLDGFQAKRTTRAAVLYDAQSSAPVYELTWRPKPLLSQEAVLRKDEKWLLLEEESGSCIKLAEALSRQQAACTTVSIHEAAQKLGQAHWSAVVYRAGSNTLITLDSPWSHPERPGIEFLLAFAKHCASAITVPKLWVIAPSTLAVAPEEDVSLARAPLLGMLRTLGLEHSAAAPVLIDIAADKLLDDEASIIREMDANTAEPLVAVRGNTRYVARMISHLPQSAESRKLVIGTPGRLDDLKLEPASRTPPADHELEIEVRATGLNFRDVLNALGMFGVQDPRFGAECAGIVSRVGPAVHDVVPGQPVLAFAPFSFQTYVNVPRQYLVPLPANMTFSEAAGIPVAFLTAWYGLRKLASLSAGQSILIHAAAGGLGQAALQIAKTAGAVIYATAGSEEKRTLLRTQGVQHVFDSRSLSFRADLLKATGGAGVDVVLNSLADDFIPASLASVAPNGCFIEVGKRGIWTHEQVRSFRSDIRYFPFDLGDVALEKPELVAEMLGELVPQFATGRLQPLRTTVYPLEAAAQAFRTMAQATHVGKLVLTHGPRERKAVRDILSEGTVLVTGGVGAIGCALAGWLADQGARELVLCSRRAEEDNPAVQELRKRGIKVSTKRADVSSYEQMEALLTHIRSQHPPLTAVFHAAGIVQDAMLATEEWPSYVAATAAKIQGAWNLHRLTQRDPVKLMVLFSSAASLLGSAGQGSYAAANAFLDGLAHYRSSRGMETCSVNWGAWAAAGMAARLSPEHSARWKRQGVHPMEASAALSALEIALRSQRPQTAIMDVDWQRFVEGRSAREAALFEELMRPRNKDAATAQRADDPLSMLRTAPANERKSRLANHIRSSARKVLSMDATSPIQDDVPLQEIGLDSLMALELRNELAQSLELTLSAGLLFNYPTVAELAEHLHSLIFTPTAEPAPIRVLDTDDLEAVKSLTDEEAELLLIQELEGSGGTVHA